MKCKKGIPYLKKTFYTSHYRIFHFFLPTILYFKQYFSLNFNCKSNLPVFESVSLLLPHLLQHSSPCATKFLHGISSLKALHMYVPVSKAFSVMLQSHCEHTLSLLLIKVPHTTSFMIFGHFASLVTFVPHWLQKLLSSWTSILQFLHIIVIRHCLHCLKNGIKN